MVLFLLWLAAGCGSPAPPHSDYFVVTFLANTPAPSDAGVDALDHAVRQAGRRTPTAIVLTCATPDDGTMPELTKQRIDALTQAFVRSGVEAGLIRSETHRYDAKSFGARRNTIILQLAYGEVPR
jgi:hypothetical protein